MTTLYFLLNKYFTETSNAGKTAIQALKTNIASVESNMSPINNALDSAVNSIQTLMNDVNSLDSTLGSTAKNVKEAIGDIFAGIVELLLLVLILICAVQILIMVLTFLKPGCKCFRYFLHIFWILLQIFMIIGFLMLALISPLTYVITELCVMLDGVLSSPDGYKQQKLPSSIE